MSNDWLQKLKVGDEVAVIHNGRFTLKRIVGESPRTWKLCEYGVWGNARKGSGKIDEHSHIEPVTQEMRDYEARLQLLRRVDEIRFHGLSLDQLRRIVAILDESEGKE